MEENKPLVSVWMTTYNHEKYIAQAIQSVIDQKTDFKFELLIGEDCSTDHTPSVCRDFAHKYPNIIKLFSREKNIGMMENSWQTFYEATGKYIAILEGDDYWIDNSKLQKQVDFLEHNSNMVLCFSRGIIVNTFQNSERIGPDKLHTGEITIEKLLQGNNQLTVSCMFRRDCLKTIPKWFKESPFGDYAIYLTLMINSGKKAFCLDDVTACYRLHAGGTHGKYHHSKKMLVEAYQKELVFYFLISKHLLNSRQIKIVSKIISERYDIISSLLADSREYFRAFFVNTNALRYGMGIKKYCRNSLKIIKSAIYAQKENSVYNS